MLARNLRRWPMKFVRSRSWTRLRNCYQAATQLRRGLNATTGRTPRSRAQRLWSAQSKMLGDNCCVLYGSCLIPIYSPDLVSTEHEYLLAKKNSESLQQSKVSGVASGAASLFSATKERLLQWEVSPAEIEKLDQGGKAITDLTVNSPVSGYITQKNSLPNMYVQPETMLYTVADLSDVWVLAQVFQSDAGKIKPGDPAEVTVDAYPGPG